MLNCCGQRIATAYFSNASRRPRAQELILVWLTLSNCLLRKLIRLLTPGTSSLVCFIQKFHIVPLGLRFSRVLLDIEGAVGVLDVFSQLVLDHSLVHGLEQQGLFYFLHFLCHCLLKSCVSREILRVRAAVLAFLHPRVTPDLTKCRPLFEVVGHHPKDEVFEFIGVLVHPKRQIYLLGKVKPGLTARQYKKEELAYIPEKEGNAAVERAQTALDRVFEVGEETLLRHQVIADLRVQRVGRSRPYVVPEQPVAGGVIFHN